MYNRMIETNGRNKFCKPLRKASFRPKGNNSKPTTSFWVEKNDDEETDKFFLISDSFYNKVGSGSIFKLINFTPRTFLAYI